MDKHKDDDFGFETDLLSEIEEALRDPSIKLRVRNTISSIESLQEENSRLTKEIEKLKKHAANSQGTRLPADLIEHVPADSDKPDQGEAKVIKQK